MSDPAALLQQRLDMLCQQGAPQHEPLLWHLAQALARRAGGQAEVVRQPLLARLQHWLDVLQHRLAQRPQDLPQPACASDIGTGPGPLGELLRQLATPVTEPPQLHKQMQMQMPDHAAAQAAPAPELKALSQSRSTWARLRMDRQLQRSRASVPAHAGPLNSQRLVLQTLQTLRSLSPDYLDALLVQLDALAWLETSMQAAPPPAAHPPGSARRRRGTR